jgi:3-oxoacyl-[acyl-carrier-protein] synthase III
MRAAITALGHYLPPDVLDNRFFETRLDTTDEWIRSRTGICERRIARRGGTSELVTPAVIQCLAQREMPADCIDCLIVATVTPDYLFPSTAATVLGTLGARNAWGFDVSAACCGFVIALSVAVRLVETGAVRNALVCGADKMSSVTDYRDRRSSILFGDAAGAVLVEASSDASLGIIDHIARVDGGHVCDLYMPAGGSARPASFATVANREHYLVQNGSLVFKAATKGMADITKEILKRNGLQPGDVRWFVPHQANGRIIEAVAERLGLDSTRVMYNVHRLGNTSSATIPVCLSEWMEAGELEKNDNIVLTSFGAGFTTAAAYIRWAIPREQYDAPIC